MGALPTGSRTITLSADEADYVEFCLAQRRELLTLADVAPDGTVLARAEQATRTAARRYGHRLLAEGINRRVTSAEKKNGTGTGLRVRREPYERRTGPT